MIEHRCTGWLCLWLLLLPGVMVAQSAEELLASEEYIAAAQAFAARGTREGNLAAGEALAAAGQVQLAIAAYEKVLLAGPDSLSGLAQHRIGATLFNDYQDSLAGVAYRRAIAIRDKHFSGAVSDRAKSRLNLAQIFAYSGQVDSAELLLREAIDIYAAAQPTDSLNWMRALTSLTSLAEDSRDYQVATSAARRATALLEAQPDIDAYDAFDTWYTTGSAYNVFGDLANARRCGERALAVASELGEPLEMLQANELLGGVSKKEGQLPASVEYHLRALEIAASYEVQPLHLGLINYNLALVYTELGKFEQSYVHQQRALPLLRGEPLFLPRLHSIEDDVHRGRGDTPRALAVLDRGIELLIADQDSAPVEDMTPAQLEVYADLLGDRAEMLADGGNTIAARRDYRELFRVQDALRQRVTSDESRNYLSRNLRKYFDRAIELEYLRYAESPDEDIAWYAFELSERAKAYSLLTAVQRDRNQMPARESSLRARIARLEREEAAESVRLAAARLELDRLLRRQGQKAQALPLFDRNALLGRLAAGPAVLLAFHVGTERGYRFSITAHGDIAMDTLPQTEELARRVNRWREGMVNSAYERKSLRPAAEQQSLDRAWLREGFWLYENCFAGLPGGTDQLYVLPDGPLTLTPVSALPTDTAISYPLDYSFVNYLQDRYAISYVYSARVWQSTGTQAPVDYQYNLLAFAPEFRGTATAGAARAARLKAGSRALTALEPLRFSQEEVREITKLVPAAESVVGAGADRAAFLAGLGRARILHLSTHGVVNVDAPELSFVAFSQLGDSLAFEEMLYYNDLAALPVRAELAVLSACETSLGEYVPGETTLSLASAFTAAGARSTLTSLWQVDDAATKELMVNFYRHLMAGEDRAAALRRAQHDHRSDARYAHPYYWSAMTLYGEAGPLALEVPAWYQPVVAWLVAAGAIVVMGLLLLRQRKK